MIRYSYVTSGTSASSSTAKASGFRQVRDSSVRSETPPSHGAMILITAYHIHLLPSIKESRRPCCRQVCGHSFFDSTGIIVLSGAIW